MKKFIDLTMPLYDYMPVGNTWAWDIPFETELITTYEKNGFQLFKIQMHSETGTRLMIPAMQDLGAAKVDELDLTKLILKDTVVVDIPKGAAEVITDEDILASFQDVNMKEGDAVIVRTGWGDAERYYELGDDYARKTPHWSKKAAEVFCAMMNENNSDLVICDVSTYGLGTKYMLPQWAAKPSWERAHYPAQQAKKFLAEYTKEKAEEDWQSPPVFNRTGVMFVGAAVNLGAITKDRIQVIVLPMKIKGAEGASCNVVAIEQ